MRTSRGRSSAMSASTRRQRIRWSSSTVSNLPTLDHRQPAEQIRGLFFFLTRHRRLTRPMVDVHPEIFRARAIVEATRVRYLAVHVHTDGTRAFDRQRRKTH